MAARLAAEAAARNKPSVGPPVGWVSLADAAADIGVSRGHLRRAVHGGELEARRDRGRPILNEAQLDHWIEGRRREKRGRREIRETYSPTSFGASQPRGDGIGSASVVNPEGGIHEAVGPCGVPSSPMAQEVVVSLTDDLDGSAAEETIVFSLDGAGYEIDLNAKNAAALHKALEKYVRGARRSSTPPGTRRSRSASRRSTRSAEVDPKAVRAWAQEQGLEVSNRGRIPAEILDRYRAAGGA